MPFALRKEMNDKIQDMLNKGIIEESCSPWSSAPILFPKKSQDAKPKYRFGVDFRALNAVTQFDVYPLPLFDETVSTLHGSKYFSVIDCYSGFWQIKIAEEEKSRQPFRLRQGTIIFVGCRMDCLTVLPTFRG